MLNEKQRQDSHAAVVIVIDNSRVTFVFATFPMLVIERFSECKKNCCGIAILEVPRTPYAIRKVVIDGMACQQPSIA